MTRPHAYCDVESTGLDPDRGHELWMPHHASCPDVEEFRNG